MADTTILQTKYSLEFTAAYEQKESWLRGTVTTEGEVNGDTFVFIIESTADTAVERGANGNIPYANDDQSSASCTLKEYHHLARKNRFRIFASSAPQRLSMASRGVVSINNKTDALILAQLGTTTYTTNSGTGAANSLALMLEASSILDTNYVPNDGNRYGLLTPKAMAQAMKINQFSSGDWVSDKPFMRMTPWRQWNNIKWTMHPNLTNKGANNAACLVYHKFAAGHAMNKGDIQTKVGENEEHDYSWARATSYQGAKALQIAGIVKLVHDDTAAL